MKILLIGECNSDNLGDLVISECIEYLISNKSNVEIRKIDLSLRKRLKDSRKGTHNKLINNTFFRRSTIFIIIKILVKFIINRQYIRDQINNIDKVFIGGGQLLQDNNLQFPLKLYIFSKLLIRNDIDYSILCCGCSDRFSVLGKWLINYVINGAKQISVRDKISKENMLHIFHTDKRINIIVDPAIFSYQVYEIKKKRIHENSIGINIICYKDLKSRMKNGLKLTSDDYFDNWIRTIIQLSKSGNRIGLFTNGDLNDYDLSEKIYRELKSIHSEIDVKLYKKPCSSIELIEIIVRHSNIISHRLHANILAYSHDINCVGLNWDNKVRGFYDQFNISHKCFDNWQNNLIGCIEKVLIDNGINKDNDLILLKEHRINDYLLEFLNS